MKLRLWFFCFVAIILQSCAGSKRAENDALLHLQMGTNYIKQSDFSNALRELLAAEKKVPNHPVVLNNLGIAYIGHGKIQTGIEFFTKAIEAKKDYSDARNNLARIYIEIGEYDKAIHQLDIVVEDLTFDHLSKVWFNLGLAYFSKKSYETAESNFFKSLRLNRKDCQAFNYYGRSLYEQKKYNLAKSVFDQAITLCAPLKNPEPHYFGALSYLEAGDAKQAKARLKEIINLYPENSYAKKSSEMLNIIK